MIFDLTDMVSNGGFENIFIGMDYVLSFFDSVSFPDPDLDHI
jgi:hypothetical protein